MDVQIINNTVDPVDTISFAAGVCYGKKDTKPNRVDQCFAKGHMSVFEHATVSFYIEGISRACLAQLTRHRLASFCVTSQRYTTIDAIHNDDWFVVPPDMEMQEDLNWTKDMMDAGRSYDEALLNGINPEDARYLLPMATKTNLVMTMNVRELYHFFDLRTKKNAQWEIRELANKMLSCVENLDNQWEHLIHLWKRKYHVD